MAVDRASLVKSTLGDYGQVPPGPISALVGIWDPDVRQLPYDTAQAARLLSLHGWRDHDADADGAELLLQQARVLLPQHQRPAQSIRALAARAIPRRRRPRRD